MHCPKCGETMSRLVCAWIKMPSDATAITKTALRKREFEIMAVGWPSVLKLFCEKCGRSPQLWELTTEEE